MTTPAQKRAQARYDAKRHKVVSFRISPETVEALDSLRRPGETRTACLERVISDRVLSEELLP